MDYNGAKLRPQHCQVPTSIWSPLQRSIFILHALGKVRFCFIHIQSIDLAMYFS